MRALAATAVAVLVVTFTGVGRSAAAFYASTTTGESSFAAGSGFGYGGLTVWGDAGDIYPVPTQLFSATTWSTIAAGNHFNCGVQTDASLWCLGQANSNYQQGADNAVHYVPQKVGNASWSQVATGSTHACGVQTDTTLMCWGNNANGQTGQNLTTGNTTTPKVPVSAPATGWAQVSTGSAHSCAVRTDGTLYCWGLGTSGQLGNVAGTASQAVATAVTVPAADGWSSVSVGNTHTCALRTDQTLYCWGDNAGYKLGQGGTSQVDSATPLAVTGTAAWTGLSAGYDHTCGLKTGGLLFCWGIGTNGRLGNNSASGNVSTPYQVSPAIPWRSVSGSNGATCAIQTNGALWCWGNNVYGQLGQNDLTQRLVPVPVGADTNWANLGQGSNPSQVCATRTDGTAWCQGDPGVVRFTPQVVGSATNWRSVAVGDNFTCGVQTGDSLWCRGLNTYGRLGTGDANPRFQMTQITSPSVSWKQVSAGTNHACAVGTDTTLYCWGRNNVGQIGAGTATTQYLTPNPVLLGGVATGWTSVTAGSAFTCATRTDATVYCWGDNASGQLGQGITGGTATAPAAASAVTAVGGWATLQAGASQICGLRTDRTLYCWGLNSSGQLGNNSTTSTGTPVQVVAADGVPWRTFGAGASHVCAVKVNGTLWCWGAGSNAQLGGPGVVSSQRLPAQVGSQITWRQVGAGNLQTCAVQLNNSVWCWGNNRDGQLGQGAAVTTLQLVPLRVPGVTGRPVLGGGSSGAVALIGA